MRTKFHGRRLGMVFLAGERITDAAIFAKLLKAILCADRIDEIGVS